MSNNLSQDNIFYKGDTIELQFQLFTDKATNTYWVLTNNKIRFELHSSPTSIKKATANVTGGADAQILVTNATQGIFIVTIAKTETVALTVGDYEFEIQIDKADGKRYTVLSSSLRLLAELITWENI